jgi:hypothetical protein
MGLPRVRKGNGTTFDLPNKRFKVSLVSKSKGDRGRISLPRARKGNEATFDQSEDSSSEFDLDQTATLPSLGSDIGPPNRLGEIFKDPVMAFSRLFPEDYLEEKYKESFGILSEELCHSLIGVSVLISSHYSPVPPDMW